MFDSQELYKLVYRYAETYEKIAFLQAQDLPISDKLSDKLSNDLDDIEEFVTEVYNDALFK